MANLSDTTTTQSQLGLVNKGRTYLYVSLCNNGVITCQWVWWGKHGLQQDLTLVYLAYTFPDCLQELRLQTSTFQLKRSASILQDQLLQLTSQILLVSSGHAVPAEQQMQDTCALVAHGTLQASLFTHPPARPNPHPTTPTCTNRNTTTTNTTTTRSDSITAQTHDCVLHAHEVLTRICDFMLG
jgi:hypothetical protein